MDVLAFAYQQLNPYLNALGGPQEPLPLPKLTLEEWGVSRLKVLTKGWGPKAGVTSTA